MPGERTRRLLKRYLGGLLAVLLVLLANLVDVTSGFGRAFYVALLAPVALSLLVYPFLLFRSGEPVEGSVRWGSAVALCIAAFLALESLFRVFPIHDGLGLNPGKPFMWPDHSLPKNSLGYQDREPGPKRGPRILVLGDSYAEGVGVRRAERFSSQLEELYRTTDPNLQVLNSARSGRDTFQESEVLLATGDTVQPDVIVVAYVLNDHQIVGSRASLPTRFMVDTLGSYAYYRLFTQWRMRGLDGHFLASVPIDPTGWQRMLAGMDRIAVWSRERGVPVFLVVLPHFTPGAEAERKIIDRVVEAARSRGFHARSSLPDYDGRFPELAVSRWDMHPGAEAHDIIARELHRWLGRPWSEPPAAVSAPPGATH